MRLFPSEECIGVEASGTAASTHALRQPGGLQRVEIRGFASPPHDGFAFVGSSSPDFVLRSVDRLFHPALKVRGDDAWTDV
jgi:hypothetical protein